MLRASLLSLSLVLVATSAGRADPDIHDTKFLTQPAVSATHVAFIYADDLWVADLDGKNVRRLTSHIGTEARPVFSPDGRSIAFSAEYDGNLDAYVIPVEGGAPRRLTWHPGPDLVLDFTPDGQEVLFASPRQVFTNRYTQLFTVPVAGGMATQLPIPNASRACFSPDGLFIAYNPLGDRSGQWKHYRGGTHGRIWVYRRKDHAVVQVPQPKARCNDLDPHWVGGTVYFRSDRAGEYNLFAYDTKTKEVRQLTKHQDFPVLNLGSGGGKIVYEQAGYLHILEPESGSSQRLKIGVATTLLKPGRASSRGQNTSATPASRPPRRGPFSTSAAKSSPSPPPRAIRATSPTRPASMNAPPPGRRTASPLPISPTRPANTSCMSVRPTARARRRRTSSTAPASTTRRSGHLIARRLPSATIRSRCSGSIWPKAR